MDQVAYAHIFLISLIVNINRTSSTLRRFNIELKM